MFMVEGSKRFILMDPNRNDRFYEGHIREGILSYDRYTHTFTKEELMESTSMVHSPINIMQWDSSRSVHI